MKKSHLIAGAVIIVIIGLIAWAHYESTHHAAITTVPDTSSLAGIQTGAAPWAPEIAHLKERLAADNLPALAEEGNVLHIHQHLDLFIDGTPVPLPAGIGIDEPAGYISPIHVHDDTSIIHVESTFVADFTLGQFFDIWGVRFSGTCIGGYCADATHSLKVYVNGEPYTGDPRLLVLAAHQEIVIAYGTGAELPKSVPSTFNFPSGY
jgi:hypothetical protein